jgi:hypothetical protein
MDTPHGVGAFEPLHPIHCHSHGLRAHLPDLDRLSRTQPGSRAKTSPLVKEDGAMRKIRPQ